MRSFGFPFLCPPMIRIPSFPEHEGSVMLWTLEAVCPKPHIKNQRGDRTSPSAAFARHDHFGTKATVHGPGSSEIPVFCGSLSGSPI